MREKFTSKDAGCYADGSLGHDHIRHVLAAIVTNVYGDSLKHWADVAPAVETLRGPMTDDAWEEDMCLDYLNDWCEEDCYFSITDGDLLLLVQEEAA